MRVEARVYRGNYVHDHLVVERNDDVRFSKLLELCLLDICKQLDVSPPLWMEKNTREFAKWHQTIFHADQFMDTVFFSRLQIRWLDDEKD